MTAIGCTSLKTDNRVKLTFWKHFKHNPLPVMWLRTNDKAGSNWFQARVTAAQGNSWFYICLTKGVKQSCWEHVRKFEHRLH